MKNNRRNQKPLRSGFTLIEVMIVLLILAMIAGLGVAAVQQQLARGKKRTAYNYVKILKKQVDLYAFDMNRPPTTEQGIAALITCPPDASEAAWGGPYLEVTATSTDPWGNEYQYVYPGKNGEEFSIWSYGPDGMDGTDDDIGSWQSSL